MPRSDRFTGKVALVTGAARGQGRSHAVALAAEGADVIAIDICRSYEVTEYPGATPADLAETAALVEKHGRRVVAAEVDVRDLESLGTAVDDAVAQLGRLDVVVANAGICVVTAWDEVTPQIWQDTIDTNLTGAWHTILTTAPHLIRSGGGAIICIGSTCGIRGVPFFGPYVAAKHGLVGIAKTMANELAPQLVRVNVVHPTGVHTTLTTGLDHIGELLAANPMFNTTFQNALPTSRVNGTENDPEPIEKMKPIDITNAVLHLASDEARYVTGIEYAVDAGNTGF
jgi:SDR family mycofactocin-dependent oxidoreductase